MEYSKPEELDQTVRVKGANKLWYAQVDQHMGKYPFAHYKEAEIDLFKRIYLALRDEGRTVQQIKDQFNQTYGMTHCSYYTRYRKAARSCAMY